MAIRLSRRGFLGFTAGSGLALCGASAARADELPPAGISPAGLPRVLELFNTHTAETLSIAYRCATGLVPDALTKLQWLLRDHRANESAPMDPLLFDQLAALAASAGVAPRFEIISGYRSPGTNARLAEAGRGVAKHSLHMEGRAIDVRLHGVPCDQLRDLALAAARGGVGYYQQSDFVHVDTGRVRAWSG